MAELVDGGKRTSYKNYQEYVERQDSRFHDYDCPNCLKNNNANIDELRKRGIKFEKLLDIGCRDAAYFDGLKKEGVSCTGIDISPKSVAYAKSKGRIVIRADVTQLSSFFDQEFDLIMSNHTLEHFLEPGKAINECRRVLKDNGHILIKVPNEGEIVTDTKHFAHVMTYNEEKLRKLLVNFEIVHFELTATNEFFVIAKR